MVKLIGRTSLRRSPKSEQAKKFLNKGASVLYVGSTDVCNPSSADEMNCCISKILEAPTLSNTKIFINSQDYLRVINAQSGKVIFCVPVDVIVNCIKAQEKYIVFSASTSINPNSNTISMAHVFECTSDKQVDNIYDALHRTIEAVRKRADLLEDASKVAPSFSKLKLDKSPANRDSNLVTYQSSLRSNVKMSGINNDRQAQEHKIAVTNHALFRNAFECMKQGNQERLHALIYSDLDILFADDAGQTLLHLSVRIDKISMCKFLFNHCCASDVERDSLRLAKDKEGMTALHLAAIYGLKNFVKFLAKDFTAVNIKDIKGRIPLHYCAGKIMHREMTHILVDHGSRIEEPEVDGVKPISIEPALSKIQELSVSGAFVFINSLNFLDRTGKRIDSGVDIACSEKTNSEAEMMIGTSVHSTDSCYSPRQDNSLTSIPEQDRLKPPPFGSYSSSQYEEDNSSYVGSSDSSPVSISDKMRHLREELSRMINLLMNPECHKYLLPQMCNEKTANKLIIIAQYPLLTDDCAQAIALLLHHLFRPTEDKSGHSIRKCVENGLLKTLVKLLDSHVTIQAQAISILEEVFSQNKGERSEVDYIEDFSELDPELLITLILENDLPASNAKQKQVQNEMNYAKRLRSLSSPSEIGESFKNGNAYFTKNWSRRLLIRILSRTSLTKKMRRKMNTPRVVKELVELMNCPTMEIREHAVCTLANMALSADNHEILLDQDILKKFRDQIVDNQHVPVLSYHCTRGLVYLGYPDVPQYVFEHNLKGQGIEEDRLWSNQHEQMFNHPEHHFVKAATLEDIVVIMTSDPSLLWNNIPLRLPSKPEHQAELGVQDNEIIRFVLSLHRTFADTVVFFRLLLHRFSDPNVAPAKRYQQDIPPVHSKVCNVLCIWMEEFPYHFMEEPEILNELEVFVVGLEDYGPVYYDLRDQIALKSQTVQIVDNGHALDKVTHLDHYKHCRASLMNEEFPLSVKTVSWLSALRGVIEKANLQEPPQSFFRSILNFKERELTCRLKAVIPTSYQTHPDVLAFTKNLYENLVSQNLGDREWQHLFVEAYFNHPLYKTELFYDLFLQLEDPDTTEEDKLPVIVGVNEHHFVVVDRHTNEIIGHHPLTNLQKPIQWCTKPLDNVLFVSMDQEYQLIGQNPSDIEMLATLMIQHMGGKIELVDNMFYIDDEDFSDSDRIVTNNRHSWHANTKNGYSRLDGDCPPTTPCGGNSVVDISQANNYNESAMLNARSRLSLNLNFMGQKTPQTSNPLRRVHTTNDVTIMNETLKLVESIPRTSLTDRLKTFSMSTSLTSRLDKLDSVRTDGDSDEDILPKVPPNDSLIGPPLYSGKRSMKRSPRISPKQSWERGVVKIDPETAQETVIITEKCNVLYQLKTSGASTPSTPPDSAFTPHLRVRNMSSFRNIDTAAFTKLLAQSMEMIEERKRANRRNSAESAPIRKHSAGSSTTSTCKPRLHRPISRSKTFSQTFDKLVSAASPVLSAETPVELERFTCLREDFNLSSLHRIRKAQDTLFNMKCDCPDVSHYTPCPCPPPVDLPYDFNFNYWRLDELNLLSHHREVARQLTLRDHELFANITENDILGYTKKRDLPIVNYPSIHRCTEHFKKITNMVMTMILQCEPRDIRIKILEHFIDIAHQCILLRNFSALFSIAFSALASAAIQNLSSTWAGVSPHHSQLFTQFLEITNPANNYKIFRKLVKTSNDPTVPFLQIYIGEFLIMNEVNPDYLKKGLINLQKRRLIYRELEEIRYFQNRKYNLTEIPEMISFFLNYETGQVDDFYLRSEILKRSEREKSKKSSRRRMTYS